MKIRVLVLLLGGLLSVLTMSSLSGAALSPVAQQMAAVSTSLSTTTASNGVTDSLNGLYSEGWDMSSVAPGCSKFVCGSGSKLVALYGDSHVRMWAVAAVPALVAKGFKVIVYWIPGCTPAHISVDTPGCTDSWRKLVEDSVTKAKVKPKAVILAERTTDLTLASGGTLTASALTAGLTEAIKVLSSKGTKVIILGDNPVMMFGSNYSRSYSPASCVSAHLNDLRTCDTSLSASLTYTLSGAEKAAAVATKATFIDTTPWFCSTQLNLCPVVINNRVAYRDAFHLGWGYMSTIQTLVSAALAAPLGYR